MHIDMPVAFGRRVLLPLLIASIRPHPELSLTLNFSDATSNLLQDDVDIAIRFGAVKDSTLLVARRHPARATQSRAERICKRCGGANDVEVHALWKHQAHLSPRVRYIVDQLVAYAADGKLD